MNNTVIRKVSVLQGMAKEIAEKNGLEPNDLVILTVSLEKVIGDPLSYLLKDLESSMGLQCAGDYYDKDAERGTCTHPSARLDTECEEHPYCEYRVDPRGSTGSAKK